MKRDVLSTSILAMLLVLGACGGGGGGGAGNDSPEPPEDTAQPNVAERFTGSRPNEPPVPPIYVTPASYHVGPDVAPPAAQLTQLANQGGVTISEGRVDDVSSANDIVSYLRPSLTYFDYTGLASFRTPPIVQVEPGASQRQQELTVLAVKVINTALPYEKRLQMSSSFESGREGAISVHFGTQAEEDPDSETRELGRAQPNFWYIDQLDPDTQTYRISERGAISSKVTIFADEFQGASDNDRARIAVIVHEILHSLGLFGHITDTSTETILTEVLNPSLGTFIVSDLDRHALLAVYSKLQPGLQPEDLTAASLGSWSTVSTHLRGEFDVAGGTAAFGAAYANGLSQPWASGPRPSVDLADNTSLSGTATWRGVLLGFTPTAEKVIGDARLDLTLSSLAGQLEFTDLEDLGGNTWLDGDLGYSVVVEENFFTHSGGDSGVVRGVFVGSGHEGMAGVLERNDLSAGFGGKR